MTSMYILFFGLLYVTAVHCKSIGGRNSELKNFNVIVLDEGDKDEDNSVIRSETIVVRPRYTAESCETVEFQNSEYEITRITVGTNSRANRKAEIVEGGIGNNMVEVKVCATARSSVSFKVKIYGKKSDDDVSTTTVRPTRRRTTTRRSRSTVTPSRRSTTRRTTTRRTTSTTRPTTSTTRPTTTTTRTTTTSTTL